MDWIVEKKEQCYGCSACFNICPKDAITMKKDQEGFQYPQICQEKCVSCKLCQKVCPFYKEEIECEYQQRYYAVQSKDRELVLKSSSGGAFTILSDYVLKQGGVVYGVAFNELFVVEHERAVDADTRNKFCSSKYVQSDMKRIMEDIISDLELGKIVFFTGTPCQVAGVRSFVVQKRKSLEGLILCDFICHGVASPEVWKEYVRFLECKYAKKLVKYNFRGKKRGWHNFFPVIEMEGSTVFEEERTQNSFMLLYKTCFINRPSCYQCKYTSYERVSDITLGDFWNVNKIAPEMDDNTGTSQVLINTGKGQLMFEQCKEEIEYHECHKKDVWQPHLEYPNEIPRGRELFWKDYHLLKFEKVIQKYGKGNFMSKCKGIAIPIVKKIGLYVLAGKIYKWLFVRKVNEI